MADSRKSPAGVPQDCPCGTTRPYRACCGRFHDGPDRCHAPDAESLMRSRYSAFVLGRADYLLETWHPVTRPDRLEPTWPNRKWLGLRIRAARSIDADHAEVEFVARSRVGGRGDRLHERSRFVREAGRWYYVDGDLLD